MQKTTRALVALWGILWFGAGGAAVAAGGDGLSYEHRLSAGPLSIHIAVVDPEQYSIEAVRALDQGTGRETVSAMAHREGAVLAVNGGFFRIGGAYDGEPVGILKIEDRWFSDPNLPRAAIGWYRGGTRVTIGRVAMHWNIRIGDREYGIDGLNRERGAWQVVLYTHEFGPSTLAHGGGVELAVDGSGRVVGMTSDGNASIPLGGLVVSFGSRRVGDAPADCLGAAASVSFVFASPGGRPKEPWREMDFIVGGTPLLIRHGVRVDDYAVERVRSSFVEERHPRTAAGVRADGHWVLVVVDGRNDAFSVGMTLAELTDLMSSLGCVEALNLDGGGSSTFYLYGQIVNQPSDLTGERPVSDAIVVKPR
ncbi:MAG: phosphodiester glycosidase family protein [Acidobacteriota bacterium]